MEGVRAQPFHTVGVSAWRVHRVCLESTHRGHVVGVNTTPTEKAFRKTHTRYSNSRVCTLCRTGIYQPLYHVLALLGYVLQLLML